MTKKEDKEEKLNKEEGLEELNASNGINSEEEVLGENSDDQIVTFHPSCRSLIPEDKPLTPAPTTRQCPLVINPQQTLVYYEYVQPIFMKILCPTFLDFLPIVEHLIIYPL